MEGHPWMISKSSEGNPSCINNPHKNLLHTAEETKTQIEVLSVLSGHKQNPVLTAVLYGSAFLISD